MGSRGWVSNALTTITADAGAAVGNTNYELSAILAAETSGSARFTDYAVRVLLGSDVGSAATLASLSGTDFGGGPGKADASNHQLLSFATGRITPGDRLFLEIERTGGDAFIFVDDVALWANPIPEPHAALIWGIGGLLSAAVVWSRRKR
jgi:hypothetical protein